MFIERLEVVERAEWERMIMRQRDVLMRDIARAQLSKRDSCAAGERLGRVASQEYAAERQEVGLVATR